MIFTNTNLIDQTTLISATRQMASALVAPAETSRMDRDRVLAALALAAADLDRSDPLDVIRTVDVTDYLGCDEPLVMVSTRHYGSLVTAIYLGELNEANQVPFDVVDAFQVRLHARVDQTALQVVIRWPRRVESISMSDRPVALPSFTDVRCVLTTASADPDHLFDSDGVAVITGDRCLVCLGTGLDAPANGIYVATDVNYVRASDADEVSDFPAGKVVRVSRGDTYGDTVWQVISEPVVLGSSPLEFSMLTYPTNVDAQQAHACLIPRAAAYLITPIAAQLSDKNQAQKCSDWAAGILARPLPAHADALSRRAQTGSTYAQS